MSFSNILKERVVSWNKRRHHSCAVFYWPRLTHMFLGNIYIHTNGPWMHGWLRPFIDTRYYFLIYIYISVYRMYYVLVFIVDSRIVEIVVLWLKCAIAHKVIWVKFIRSPRHTKRSISWYSQEKLFIISQRETAFQFRYGSQDHSYFRVLFPYCPFH